MKKAPEFLQFKNNNDNSSGTSSNNNNNNNNNSPATGGVRNSIMKMLPTKNNPYSKLDALKDIKDELDQPLQPHIDALPTSKCSTIQAFGNTIKSFVGVGILALPYAIKQSGLWAGIIGLAMIGLASAYTMKILVRCKSEMELRRKFVSETSSPSLLSNYDDTDITYGYIGQHIFGKLGLYLVNFAIATSQLGFCCAYILFIGQTLNSIWTNVDMRILAVIFLPVYILLSWIRNMKYLAPVAMIANGALLLAVGTVFYYGFRDLNVHHHYPFIRVQTFPLFFGIAVFGYEGINLAIPIQNSMMNPRAYPRMLDLSLLVVGVLYILFGSLGYVFFTESVDPIIVKNLTDKGALVIIVKIALVIELLLTYPVQLFPVTIIVESSLSKFLSTHRVIKQNLIRSIIVCFSIAISVVIPHFDLLTSLIGSFSNSMVVFIFPTLFLLAIFRGRLSWPEVILNVIILAFGIAASAISSAIAIMEIIKRGNE